MATKYKILLSTVILILLSFAGFSQANTVTARVLNATKSLYVGGHRVDSISLDTTLTSNSDFILVSQKAIKTYIKNRKDTISVTHNGIINTFYPDITGKILIDKGLKNTGTVIFSTGTDSVIVGNVDTNANKIATQTMLHSLDASWLIAGSIPAARYGATTIPTSAMNATGGTSTSYLRKDGTWSDPPSAGSTNITVARYLNFDSILSSSGTGAQLDTADATHAGLVSPGNYQKLIHPLIIKNDSTGTGRDTLVYAIGDTLKVKPIVWGWGLKDVPTGSQKALYPFVDSNQIKALSGWGGGSDSALIAQNSLVETLIGSAKYWQLRNDTSFAATSKVPMMYGNGARQGWQVTPVDYINIVSLGADSTGVNSSQAAFNLALATRRPIYFPHGTYKGIKDTRLPDSTVLRGDGAVILCPTSDTLFVVKSFCNISGLVFKATFAGSLTGIALEIDSARGTMVHNCKFDSVDIPIHVIQTTTVGTGENGNIFTNLWIEQPMRGIWFGTRGEYNSATDINITHGYTGFYNGAGNNRIIGNSVTSTFTAGLDMETGTNDAHGVVSGNTFNHNVASIIANNIVNGATISDNRLYYGNITITNCTGLKFINNEIDLTTGTLGVDTSTNIYFQDNKFFSVFTTNFALNGHHSNVLFKDNHYETGTGITNYSILIEALNSSGALQKRLYYDTTTVALTIDNPGLSNRQLQLNTDANGVGNYTGNILRHLFHQPIIGNTGTAGTRDLCIGSADFRNANSSFTDPFQVFKPSGTGSTWAILDASANYQFRAMNTGLTSIGNISSPTARLNIGGALTLANNSTTGINLALSAATFTDNSTASSGTVTHTAVNAFGIPTLAASNTTVTYINASNLYIAGPPAAGTNITITNPYSLYVNTGKSLFKGAVQIQDGTQSNGFAFTSDASGNGAWGAFNNLYNNDGTIPSATTRTVIAGSASTSILRFGSSLVSQFARMDIYADTIYLGGSLSLQSNGVADANFTATNIAVDYLLPQITANRTITLNQSAGSRVIILINGNTSAFSWNFSTTVVNPDGTTVSSIPNGWIYIVQYIASSGSWTVISRCAPKPNGGHAYFTPTTGNTINLVTNQYNIINPSGTIAALTVTLPSSPNDDDFVHVKYTQAVTTVTYSGGTVADGIISPSAGSDMYLRFHTATSTWY